MTTFYIVNVVDNLVWAHSSNVRGWCRDVDGEYSRDVFGYHAIATAKRRREALLAKERAEAPTARRRDHIEIMERERLFMHLGYVDLNPDPEASELTGLNKSLRVQVHNSPAPLLTRQDDYSGDALLF